MIPAADIEALRKVVVLMCHEKNNPDAATIVRVVPALLVEYEMLLEQVAYEKHRADGNFKATVVELRALREFIIGISEPNPEGSPTHWENIACAGDITDEIDRRIAALEGKS